MFYWFSHIFNPDKHDGQIEKTPPTEPKVTGSSPVGCSDVKPYKTKV